MQQFLGKRFGAPLGRAALEGVGWHAGRVLVLMYHRVHQEPHVLSVSPERFDAQMRFLREFCRPCTLSEVVDARRLGRALPPRSVAVTFDDGYRDNFTHAFPILRKYDMPATFFVTTGMIQARQPFWWDRIHQFLKPPEVVAEVWPAMASALVARDRSGQAELVTEALKELPTRSARELMDAICHPAEPVEPVTMTWEEIRIMARAGMEIGSHTVTHPILSRQEPEEAAWEVRHSKLEIEREIGLPVTHFAYPNGRPCDMPQDFRSTLMDAGYLSAFSTIEGAVTARSEPFALERVGIYDNPGMTRFVRTLARAFARPKSPSP